jgi:Xaa-Pro aminopeptidase
MPVYAPRIPFGTEAGESSGINFDRMKQERTAKARAALKKHGIAACLLTLSDDIRYTVGGRGNFVMPRQFSYSMFFVEHDPLQYASMALGGARRMTGPEAELIRIPYCSLEEACGPENTREVAKRFAAGIKNDLKERGLEKEKLGIDQLDEPSRQALVDEGIELVNVKPALLEARAIKTEDEINCLKMAAAICDVGYYEMYKAMKPGARQQDVMATALEAVFRAGAESVTQIIIGAGVGSRSDKILQTGDLVSVDYVSVRYMGYGTCYMRQFIIGRRPTEKEKDCFKKSRDIIYRILDAIKPGVSVAEVAEMWHPASYFDYDTEEEVLAMDICHGLGLSLYEYPIASRLYSYPETFEKGMVFAIEAQESDPEHGIPRIKMEEMAIVTDKGAEIYSTMPFDDFIVAGLIDTGE